MEGQDQHARPVAPHDHGEIFLEFGKIHGREMARLREEFGEATAAAGRIAGTGDTGESSKARPMSASLILSSSSSTKGQCFMPLWTSTFPIPTTWRWREGGAAQCRASFTSNTRFAGRSKMIAQDGEFVLFPGVYPPIQGAEKVTPHMVPWITRARTRRRVLSNEFRQIFFAK